MTQEEKSMIQELRAAGLGYTAISKQLSISVNTVKSYCRRKLSTTYPCENCGNPIKQKPKSKHKRFCCDKCRNRWWNSRLELVNRKAFYDYVCPYCGKDFQAYGRRPRKYCSHQCYIKDRFGDFTNKERFDTKNERREKYKIAMSFAKEILEKNVIDKEIYDNFEEVMREK